MATHPPQEQLQKTEKVSPRAAARREEILAAARKVFVRDGYTATKLLDVAKEAGCAAGTLYTYFENREDLFTAVLQQVEHEMRSASGRIASDDPRELISAANRAYVESYANNAPELALMEQVSQTHPEMHKLRTSRARGFTTRNQRLIKSLQDDGTLASDRDAEMLALSLSIMVSRLCYSVFVENMIHDAGEAGGGATTEEHKARTIERIVSTVNDIWFRTLGL